MTGNSYIDFTSMNDQALTGLIGEFIKHNRLEQNRTQDAVARDAGISRSTLSLLERGETVTLATLIQVLRVLGKLNILDEFRVEKTISPMMLAKLEKAERKRARKPSAKTATDNESSDLQL